MRCSSTLAAQSVAKWPRLPGRYGTPGRNAETPCPGKLWLAGQRRGSGIILLLVLCLAVSGGWAQTDADVRCKQQLVIVSDWEDQATPALMIAAFEEELGAIITDLGVCFELATLEEATRKSFAGRIVVLRMLWKAKPARREIETLPQSALAWTHATSDEIKPFAAVDLTALQQFLGLPPLRVAKTSDSEALGIAAARVGAHEIFHMLTRSDAHSERGLMRPALSQRDLLRTFAPPWTVENRMWARELGGVATSPMVAAVSGEQSPAADKK